MKKLLVFLAVFVLLGDVHAQNPVDTDSLEKNIGYKIVGNKVWFMKEKIVESVVCVSGKPGCFVATTTLKPVDVYTLRGSIPEDILAKMSWVDSSVVLEESSLGKFANSYTDKYLVHYSEYDKTLYKKDSINKSIYVSGVKSDGYYDLRLMILVFSLFSLYAISLLSDKCYEKKSLILTIVLAVLWIIVGLMNISFIYSRSQFNVTPEYNIEGLRIRFLFLISIFSVIINGAYMNSKKVIPSSLIFFQMICLIFYVTSIPTTETPLSIIIPIFTALVSIKFFKSLSFIFKPTMA